MKQQHRSGNFIEHGKIISRRLQGGQGSAKNIASSVALTSYTLIASTEINPLFNKIFPKILHRSIENARNFIAAEMRNITNEPYALALAAYALKRANHSQYDSEVLRMLERLQKHDNRGRIYWSEHDDDANEKLFRSQRGCYYTPPPADVEMTSYALLTYVARNDLDRAIPVARWIMAQRSDTGGFSSTQDTVIALEALSKFSKLLNRRKC